MQSEWNNIKDRLPEESGQYWCKTESGYEFPDMWVKKLSGERVWLGALPYVVAYWRNIKKYGNGIQD